MNFFSQPQLLWGMPGGTELILIALVILLFFGGKKIPDLMRGLGRSVREFNEAKDGGKKEIKDDGTRQKPPTDTTPTKVVEKSSEK